MNHLTEEQLVLHYYGEGDSLEAERHIEECEQCRAFYGSLQRVLNVVESDPIPERGAGYEGEVWRRIEAKLPSSRWRWLWSTEPALRWACASAASWCWARRGCRRSSSTNCAPACSPRAF